MDFFQPDRTGQVTLERGYGEQDDHLPRELVVAIGRGIVEKDEALALQKRPYNGKCIATELLNEHSRRGFEDPAEDVIGPHWQTLRAVLGKPALLHFLEFSPGSVQRHYVHTGDTLNKFLTTLGDIQINKLPPVVVTIMMQLHVIDRAGLGSFVEFVCAETNTLERLNTILVGPVDPAFFTSPLGQELIRHCPPPLLSAITATPGWIDKTNITEGQAGDWVGKRLQLCSGQIGDALARSPKAAEHFFTTDEALLQVLSDSGLSERAIVLALNSQAIKIPQAETAAVAAENIRDRMQLLAGVNPELLDNDESAILAMELISSRDSYIQALRRYYPAAQLSQRLQEKADYRR